MKLRTENKSLFGKFNHIIDELGHFILTIFVISILLLSGLINYSDSIILLLLGILIDIDHLLNPFVARIFNQKATILPSTEQDGVTVKILHGIDVSAFVALFIYFYSDQLYLSLGCFIVMLLHELWDFIVYDHTYKELFLITRLVARFKPGQREKFVGIIFDQDSLPR